MKKAIFITLAIVFFAVIGNLGTEDNNANINTNTYQPQQVLGETITKEATVKDIAAPVINNNVKEETVNTDFNVAKPLEPIKYYENSAGNTVQSPTKYDAIPAEATAKCRDGSYSFSQSRRGTCSHHGGVSVWY